MSNGANDGTSTGIRRRSVLGGAVGAISMVGLGLGTMAAPAAATSGIGLVAITNMGDVIRRTDWGANGQWQGVGRAPGVRLVSSLNSNRFLVVNASGDLYEHIWNPLTNRYEPVLRGWGFTSSNTRLIAGLSVDRFLEITAEETLVLWTRSSDNSWSEQVRGWGWGNGNTRLITGLSADSFLEVQSDGHDGKLSKWVTDGSSYREITLPGNGFTSLHTEHVSGIVGGGAFYELSPFNEISRWSWAYDGASLNEDRYGYQAPAIQFIA